ncbi:hypothetical protein SAMD00023353_0501860 [Rosellinia necatrix]|uniref:Uncharacterized protein n=1 Tax=Rosellinia necatrix TaxID=77044 RepID=A0A1S7UKH7_ROSNE|nr:hypothetical protein SAMD00023353_0501860 [Rosellinia necatrix]
MTRIGPLSLLFLAVLPMSSSSVTLDSFDPFQELGTKTYTTIRNAAVLDKRGPVDKDTSSTKYSSSPTASASRQADPDRIRDRRSPRPGIEDFFAAIPSRFSSIVSAFSSSVSEVVSASVLTAVSSSVSDVVSASVLTAVSNSVSNSVLTSLTAEFSTSLQSARDEGFRDGQSQANESNQSATGATGASTSSTMESVSPTIGSTPSSVVATPSITRSTSTTSQGASSTVESSSYGTDSASPIPGGLDPVPRGLNLSSGQLAGIIVAVFLISSILSVLATLFILRYRRQRGVITHETSYPPVGSKRKMLWPTPIGKFRGITTTGNHNTAPGFAPGAPSQIHQVAPSMARDPLATAINTGPTTNNIYPVSPLSSQLRAASGRDSLPSLDLGLYEIGAQMTSGSEHNDTPPVQSPLTRNPPHITWMPKANISALSPPIVPLRFSSLNAHKDAPTQGLVGFHSDDQTFLLSTDDESAGRDARYSQDQSGLHLSSSRSSVISQDLAQFEPGGSGQQLVSRFSMSTAPLSSLEYSISSLSPVPQYHHQQQQEGYPEIAPLRPAPPSPSQLQSPIPRRPNLTTNMGISGTIYI